MKISITPEISIDADEIREEFVRAAGPGGQNVNKVATAVQVRFDVRHSPNLPEEVRARLIRIAGRRINTDGVLVIEAKQFRTQDQNRADAQTRLFDLIRQATIVPKSRRKTKPSRAAKERRLENKKRNSAIKSARRIANLD